MSQLSNHPCFLTPYAGWAMWFHDCEEALESWEVLSVKHKLSPGQMIEGIGFEVEQLWFNPLVLLVVFRNVCLTEDGGHFCML